MTDQSKTITIPGQVRRLDAAQRAAFGRSGLERGALEALLLRLRREADAALAPRMPSFAGKPWPLGRCREIRDEVFARLGALLKSRGDGGDPALAALRAYLASGGVCRRIWGDLRGRFFQNAIQIGPWYADAGNDTVDTSKPPVEILPLEESGFANIRDYAHFVRVAERYWDVSVYANTVFPALAPLLPLICAGSGRVWLAPAYDEMIELTRSEDFRPSERILAELPPAPADLREVLAARVPAGAGPLLSLAGDPMEACRGARAAGHMHSPAYRDALVEAFLSLRPAGRG